MTVAVGRRRAGVRAVAAALIGALLVSLGWLIVWYPAAAQAISQEGAALEIVQVVLVGVTGLVALSCVLTLRRSGQPYVLDAVIAAAMAGLVIGEIDLDRRVFGVKVIHTLFFVNREIPLAARALAALVVVGVPTALGIWVLVRWRALWHAMVAAVAEPWGQVFAGGGVIFAVAEVFEKPFARALFAPRNSLEESLELAASIGFCLGVVARRRALRDDGSSTGRMACE